MSGRKKLPNHMKPVELTVGTERRDGINVPVKLVIPVTMSCTKRYHATMYALLGLSGCARDLLDYLTERMDAHNIVSTDGYAVQDFVRFVAGQTSQTVRYSESAVRKSLKRLKEKGVLIPERRGRSRVNPLFMSNQTSETKRIREIQACLSFHGSGDGERNEIIVNVVEEYVQRPGMADIVEKINKK